MGLFLELTARRIPRAADYCPIDRWPPTCPICGRRAIKATTYLRHARGWMFPEGMIPDDDAMFSAVHPRCIKRQHVAPEYVFSAQARKNLEEQ